MGPRSNRFLLALLHLALVGAAGSTCAGVQDDQEESPYAKESPAQQSEEEQMEDVEDDINR
jgi:hypothetical protein